MLSKDPHIGVYDGVFMAIFSPGLVLPHRLLILCGDGANNHSPRQPRVTVKNCEPYSWASMKACMTVLCP